MDLAILIVSYNTGPLESATLQSILEADLTSLDSLHLTLWNNGPRLFTQEEIDGLRGKLHEHGVQAQLYNTDNNYGLGKIYNFFLSQGEHSHYLILDHDSILASDFFTNLASHAQYPVILPVIIEKITKNHIGPASRDKAHTPFYNLPVNAAYSSRSVVSITSGLCLSRNFIRHFSAEYGTVFNEAFCLYAVDTCFFAYLSEFLKDHPNYAFFIVNTVFHSLSKYLDEDLPVQQFKVLEGLYSHILLRLHTQKRSRRAALSYIFRKCLPRCKSLSDAISLFKVVVTKKHPRASRILDSRFSETIGQNIALSPK